MAASRRPPAIPAQAVPEQPPRCRRSRSRWQPAADTEQVDKQHPKRPTQTACTSRPLHDAAVDAVGLGLGGARRRLRRRYRAVPLPLPVLDLHTRRRYRGAVPRQRPRQGENNRGAAAAAGCGRGGLSSTARPRGLQRQPASKFVPSFHAPARAAAPAGGCPPPPPPHPAPRRRWAPAAAGSRRLVRRARGGLQRAGEGAGGRGC